MAKIAFFIILFSSLSLMAAPKQKKGAKKNKLKAKQAKMITPPKKPIIKRKRLSNTVDEISIFKAGFLIDNKKASP